MLPNVDPALLTDLSGKVEILVYTRYVKDVWLAQETVTEVSRQGTVMQGHEDVCVQE